MLAYDFIRTQGDIFDLIPLSRSECDVTSFESIMQAISYHEPDILLNCAAYTAVDDAEDIGMKSCFDINTLGSYNLARATSVFGVDFINISTDYVFDGKNPAWYQVDDACNPVGVYGMSKYLWETLIKKENSQAIIIRTSWLYGGNVYGGEQRVFKNFVNTMLRLSETKTELKVVSDQHGIPTYCGDLSIAIAQVIQNMEEEDYFWQIFHFSNSSKEGSITWADFAREIFEISWKIVSVMNCSSDEYVTKAKRPEWSILKNDSKIVLSDWKMGFRNYLQGK